jgi:site-specific recombinase XerD
MSATHKKPTPLFDSLRYFKTQKNVTTDQSLRFANENYPIMYDFLEQYTGSQDTFNAYRRELERLAQWAWLVANKSILDIKRQDIESYISFCEKPPKAWIGYKQVARFVSKNGARTPNPDWHLFVATLKKSEIKQGKAPSSDDYVFSQKALQALFTALSSFYNHLIREDLTDINPITQIRQKSQYLRRQQGTRPIRRLNTRQWEFVIETTVRMAGADPIKHERSLFVMTALYLMYLRVSELAASPRWEPQMGHFFQDSQDRWWFKTVGKGNKERDVSVSDAMLDGLKRYRASRELPSSLPTPGENTPLIHKLKGAGAITSTREIRLIVQQCFDTAVNALNAKGFSDDGNSLEEATVHWLRHTGISDDINKHERPASHVRDDAGHSSSATTDLYNDAELEARHASAKKKDVDLKS